MKFNKIFALLLAGALFTACSDDEVKWNSNEVTVSMGNTEMAVKENNGIFNVPVVVAGEMNGPVQVTVEVAETGENVAMDGVHYIVTQKTITIVPEEGAGNIEIKATDDNDINEARTFTVTIVAVNGGKVGENVTTTVTLKDNDSVFYEKLQGTWKMTAHDYDFQAGVYGSSETWTVKIVGADEGKPGYNEVLYITGIMGYEWTTLQVNYHFDMETKKGYLEIPYGTLFAAGVNFSGLGVMDVIAGTVEAVDGNLYMVDEGSFIAEWNDEFNVITFNEEDTLFGFLAPQGTTTLTGSLWFAYGKFSMTR